MRYRYQDDEDDGRWTNVDVRHPDFKTGMVRDIKKGYGDGAHLYMVGRMIEFQNANDEIGVSMWKELLELMDKMDKEEA